MELRCQLHNPAALDCVWNVMAHAQEIRFRLSAKLTSPFKSARESVQSTTGSQGLRIGDSNAGYTMFRRSVKSTGYLPHSPVSPSIPVQCVTVCHHISTEVYNWINTSVTHWVGGWLCPKTYLDVLEKKKEKRKKKKKKKKEKKKNNNNHYCRLLEFKFRTVLNTKPFRLLSLLGKQLEVGRRIEIRL